MDTKIEAIINENCTSNFYKIYDLNIKYVASLILDILKDSLIAKELETLQGVQPEELVRNLRLSGKSYVSLKWMLDFLSENGILEKLSYGEKFYYRGVDTSLKIDRFEISTEILSLDPSFKSSMDLMNLVAKNYVSFLRGEKTGVEILFSPIGMKLWNDYFNNQFSGYKIFNSLGACVVIDMLRSKKNVSILELGGGTGGAREVLFDLLYEFSLLNNVEKYIFSDISPMFVRLGSKKCLNDQFSRLNYFSKRINFDLSLTEQGIEENSIDLVYGVNALHVAKDLFFSLKSIKEILQKDGVLVISELVRDNNNRLFQEIIFNLLESYTEVKLDSVYRPLPGFLSKENWIKVFQEAGLTNIKTVTNVVNGSEPRREIVMVIQGAR